MTRRDRMAVGGAVAGALVVAGVVWVTSTGGGPGPGSTATTGTVTAPTGTVTGPSTVPAPDVPPLPPWGPVEGAPPEFTVPDGGTGSAVPSGDGTRVRIARADGSTLAVGELDADEVYRSVRYFDRKGRLRLVVSRADVGPAGPVTGSAVARAGGCRDVRRTVGLKWRTFPIPWRFRTRTIPRSLNAARVVRVARAARMVWIRNLNRCGVADRSQLTFRYRGATRRPFGRNGVNSVEFGVVARLGGVCVGAVACTFTWASGSRAVESDIRVDTRPRRPYALGGRVGSRVDLQGVLVHETGHTLGLDHVADSSNVMFPTIRVGSPLFRRLGLGDARADNALY